MKFNTWFISAGISCATIFGCNQQQKQDLATNNDDVIWKANVSYCLSREILDLGDLKWGLELENTKMYNFKITEEKGKFSDLMRLLYDSGNSKTFPIYNLNPVTGLSPDILLLQKEKQMLFSDSLWDLKHTKVTVVSDVYQLMKGITFNHEFLYDAKAGVLNSTITDASLLQKNSKWGSTFVSIAGFKFSNRANDTLGTDQPQLSSGIVWGRDELMSIIDSGQGPKQRTDHSWYTRTNDHCWYNNDSLPEYTVNGEVSSYFPMFTQPIRTNFNKKLVEWIWMAARSGQLKAYYCVGKDKIGEQIPTKEILDFGSETDTIMDEHGKLIAVKNTISSGELVGLELKEEISFHQKSFSFESKITSAGILVLTINHNTGQSLPNTSKVLYWVKLN